jgi:hypothetical protein
MRLPTMPLWKFGGPFSVRRSDVAKSGFLGDWQRWTRTERIAVVVLAAVISLVAILPLVV